MKIKKVVSGGQHPQNIIDIIPVHREAGQTGLPDGVQYGFLLRTGREGDHVGAVNHHIPGGNVVKVQNVFDEFFLVGLDGTGLFSLLYNRHDVVLRHLLLAVQKS